MIDWVVAGLAVLGAFVMLLAAVGIVRMPDVFTRMHSATKASSLGLACLLAAIALYFGDPGVTTRAVLVIAFLFLTAPVSAHVLARAAYAVGVPLWEGSVLDDLRAATEIEAGE